MTSAEFVIDSQARVRHQNRAHGKTRCRRDGQRQKERTAAVIGRARVSVPGTCGELVQGTFDGVPCLVSCPITTHSTATVRLDLTPDWEVASTQEKARLALRRGIEVLGLGIRGGRLQIKSSLPDGRGYASSTADIGAVLYALGEAAAEPLPPSMVARLAVEIEPTDSSVFPGLALWGYRDGEVFEDLGAAPEIAIVVIDPGGEVNTLQFNAVDRRSALTALADIHARAFALLIKGLEAGDLNAVGEAATLSATSHQAILNNPLLPEVLNLCRRVNGLGICRAHSGTLLGILVQPKEADRALLAAAMRFGTRAHVYRTCLSGGGPKAITTPYVSKAKRDKFVKRRLANGSPGEASFA